MTQSGAAVLTAPTVGLSGAVKFEMQPDGKAVLRRKAEVEILDHAAPNALPRMGWLAVVATSARRRQRSVRSRPGTPPGDRWTVRVAPYLWAASMDGHSAVGAIKSAVEVPFRVQVRGRWEGTGG
jgi:hypothetical protein